MLRPAAMPTKTKKPVKKPTKRKPARAKTAPRTKVSSDDDLLALYEDTLRRLEAVAKNTSGTLRDRLGAIFHGQLKAIRPQREILAPIAARLLDGRDPVSAFSRETHAARQRGVEAMDLALDGVSDDLRPLAANALWLMMLSMWLFYLTDESEGETRTHGLVDELLDMAVMLLPWLGTPFIKPMLDRVSGGLERAGVRLT
jgi:hypothetical protein